MTGSGEKHAQDKNLIWCILVALRPILLLTVYRNTLYLSSTLEHDADRGGEEADARHPPEDQHPSRGLQPRALRGQARAGRQRQEVRTLSS